jgi:hypothetical protein
MFGRELVYPAAIYPQPLKYLHRSGKQGVIETPTSENEWVEKDDGFSRWSKINIC